MHRRVAFLLFAAGWGANHFATLLVVYRKELGLSPAALGILFGAYAIGLVPGLILAGRASDARGRRALVLPASLLAIVASGVLAFGSHGFALLLAGRLLYGLAMGCVMSPGSVWVQELSTAELGPRRATLALSAGFGFGPLVSGVVAELAPAPMVMPYVTHAILMAIAFVAALPVPETANVQKDTKAAEPSAGPVQTSLLRTPALPARLRRSERRGPDDSLLSRPCSTCFHDDPPLARSGQSTVDLGPRERLLLAELIPIAPWSFGLASIGAAILPGLMRPYVGHPVMYSGFIVFVTLLSGVLVQPWTSRIGPRADLVGLAVGIVGLGIAAYTVAIHAAALALVAAVFVGVGYGLVITTGLRDVSQRISGRARGTAVGIYYVLTYIGFALPFGFATLAERLSITATFGAIAAVATACLILRTLRTIR